jgi:uncharacterized membrane protein YccC
VSAKQSSWATAPEKGYIGRTVGRSLLLALCCLLSYKLISILLAVSRFAPRDDQLLGGMWAVVATIFVFRESYEESAKAALMRTSATLFSFAVCLMYLLVFPFRVWGMVALIAIGGIVLDAMGRSEDIMTACITIAVVLVVAGISPEHAWKQPILRLTDTLVGIAFGLAGAWTAARFAPRPRNQSAGSLQNLPRASHPAT